MPDTTGRAQTVSSSRAECASGKLVAHQTERSAALLDGDVSVTVNRAAAALWQVVIPYRTSIHECTHPPSSAHSHTRSGHPSRRSRARRERLSGARVPRSGERAGGRRSRRDSRDSPLRTSLAAGLCVRRVARRRGRWRPRRETHPRRAHAHLQSPAPLPRGRPAPLCPQPAALPPPRLRPASAPASATRHKRPRHSRRFLQQVTAHASLFLLAQSALLLYFN